jgi:hypothetical protein
VKGGSRPAKGNKIAAESEARMADVQLIGD